MAASKRKILCLIPLLFAFQAKAQLIKFPACDPVFIAGPQGRPIPNAVVSITRFNGSIAPNGIWLDYLGTQRFDGQIPPNQILQVYADAGLYHVTLSGAGLTKDYYITCSIGASLNINKISIDRTADMLLINTPNPPQLSCPTNQDCFLQYQGSTVQTAFFDFVMPSFPITLETVLLTWTADPSGTPPGVVVWKLNWCSYHQGQSPCNIQLATHIIELPTLVNTTNTRNDTLFAANAWDATWLLDDHVLVSITWDVVGPNNSYFSPVNLSNARLEFVKE